MNLLTIAWRSMRQRALASALTGFSMALGVTLVVAVLVINGVVGDTFRNNAGTGFDVIVGAKGGKLQLVLNTVYHLSTPVENIPYSYLREFTQGKYKPYISRAIPYCLGDSFRDHRVVATVAELLGDTTFAPGRKYAFSSGRNFKNEVPFEGVLGSVSARKTGLKVGDTFRPTHGVEAAPDAHEHDAFTVVGILEPSGTPNDRAVFINIEGFYLLENHAKPVGDEKAPAKKHEDHDDHDHEPLPEAQRELSAILIKTAGPMASLQLPNLVNEGNVAQAVLPIREINGLFEIFVGPIDLALLVLTVLIVIVSGIGILVSIYNSMNDRRREIAVMRALGARRSTIMTIVLLESILLSLGGGLAGWLLGHALIAGLGPVIASRTGVALGLAPFVPAELALIPGLIALATLVGYLPALSAYRTDVARALSSSP